MFKTPSYILHRISDVLRPSWTAAPETTKSIPLAQDRPVTFIPSGFPDTGLFNRSKNPPVMIVESRPNPKVGAFFYREILSMRTELSEVFHVTEDGPYILVRIPNGSALPVFLDIYFKYLPNFASLHEVSVQGWGLNLTPEQYEELRADTRELVIPITGYGLGSQYFEQRPALELSSFAQFAIIVVGHPLIAGKEITVFGFRAPEYLNPLHYAREPIVDLHMQAIERMLEQRSRYHLMKFGDAFKAIKELKPIDTVQFLRTPQFGVSIYRKSADPDKHLPLTTFNSGLWYTQQLMPSLSWTKAASEKQGVLGSMQAELERTLDFLQSLPEDFGGY